MSLALVRKELREHGVLLFIAWALAAVALQVQLNAGEEIGGRFIPLRAFELFAGTLLVMVMANRLLAREYAGRTQLFLEILPLSRARVFISKWVLGCALFLLTTALAWFVTFRWIQRSEALPLRDALVTLGSVSLYAFSLWSFAALAAMLGRYRYFVWLFAALGIVWGTNLTGTSFDDVPVIRLLDEDVAMARSELSALDLLIPTGLSLICLGAAAVLALRGSGAIASMLAQRITSRELSFIAILSFSLLAVLGSLESKPVKPKFALTEGAPVLGRRTSVEVLSTGDFDATAANALANTIVADVDSLIAALELRSSPSIAVMPQQGLDPEAMQRASLSASDGIVLKVAPNAPQDSLRALVLHSLLSDETLGRSFKEDRHVLLDGMAAYWPIKDDAQLRNTWWLRAAAVPDAVSARELRQWSATSEQLGECLSQAVAFGVMDIMADELGSERLSQLMRQVFTRPHDDVRVLFERTPSELLAAAGLSWPALATKLAALRKSVRAAHPETFQQRPRPQAHVSWREDRKRGLIIEVDVRGVLPYRVLYKQLGLWTTDVASPARLDARTERAVLPISPTRGARVLTAIETEDALLGCPVRIFARRVTLQ